MKKNSLLAKVALITGSARRIGAEIARTLHHEGMNIVIHYNQSEDDAIQLALELNTKREHSAIILKAELLLADSLKSLVDRACAEWQRLDLLVNNASRYYRTQMGEVTEYAWDDLLDSNVKAPFLLAQFAAPYLSINKGAIINITDIHANQPLKDYSVYSISKSALLMATKVLAKELGPDIRVNAVAPGPIIWPEGENTLSETDKQKIIGQTLLKRAGSTSDVAKAVLFFARDAEYITGQVLNVDGGRSAS